MACPSPFKSLDQCHQLCLSSDKAGESPRRRRLQAPPDPTGPDQLPHLHRLMQPFDRHRPEGLDVHIALHQTENRRGNQNRARLCHLLHARCQMGGLADGRVVHMQIVADGPHDDLSRVEAYPNLYLHPMGPAPSSP